MNTKFVGIKEFRQNIATFAKRARSSKERFIIVNRNKPLFELKPFAEDTTLDSLFVDLLKAEQDIKEGKYYTHKQMLEELS